MHQAIYFQVNRMFKKKNNSSDTIETEVPIKYVTYPSNWDDIYNYKYQLGITKKEAEYSFFVTKKEVNIVASRICYDRRRIRFNWF